MSAEENKAILKKFFEKPDKTDEERRAMHTPGFVHHWHEGTKNLDEVLAERAARRQGRGPARPIVDDMIAEGDRVAVWATIKRGAEDDRHVCLIYRLSDGKIAEAWNMISIQSGSFGALPHE